MNILRNTLLLMLMVCPTILWAEPTGKLFVTNEGDDTITVINAKTFVVEKNHPVGKRPRGIGLSANGKHLYVALSDENAIVVLDPVTLKEQRRINAGSDPETFAVHPNGHIYASNEDDAKASVLDPKTGRKVAEISVGLEPEGVAISPDGSNIVVTSESTNLLHVIGYPEHKIIANILVGARPRAATFDSTGKRLYASCEISGEIVEIDMASYSIVAKTQIGDGSKPKDLRLGKGDKLLYVAGGRSNQVHVFDAKSLKEIKTIPVGKRVWGLAMSRDKKRLFTTDGVSNTVSVINTEKNVLIHTIKVGDRPWGLVLDD